MSTKKGLTHGIRQNENYNIFDDVIQLYKDKAEELILEHPFCVRYLDGKAVDIGGVQRDMFSAFWERAYIRSFDGGNVLAPAVHPHVDMAVYPLLGTVLSHGYISCGFLPIRIAFPVIASCLKGPSIQFPDSILIQSFLDYVSTLEGTKLHHALQSREFTLDQQADVISILSRMGCREMPTAANLKHLIVQVAKHELLLVPVGAIYALHSGIPTVHRKFWDQFTVGDLYRLYSVLNATTDQVIQT